MSGKPDRLFQTILGMYLGATATVMFLSDGKINLHEAQDGLMAIGLCSLVLVVIWVAGKAIFKERAHG